MDDLADVTRMLRKTASDIDLGNYGEVGAAVLSIKTPAGYESFGFGDAPNKDFMRLYINGLTRAADALYPWWLALYWFIVSLASIGFVTLVAGILDLLGL